MLHICKHMAMHTIYSLIFSISALQSLEEVESGYRLPPPPGCPRAIYRLMMKCWYVGYAVIRQYLPVTNNEHKHIRSYLLLSLCYTYCVLSNKLRGYIIELDTYSYSYASRSTKPFQILQLPWELIFDSCTMIVYWHAFKLCGGLFLVS